VSAVLVLSELPECPAVCYFSTIPLTTRTALPAVLLPGVKSPNLGGVAAKMGSKSPRFGAVAPSEVGRIWQVFLKFRAYQDLDLAYGSLPAWGLLICFGATLLFLVLPYTWCGRFLGSDRRSRFESMNIYFVFAVRGFWAYTEIVHAKCAKWDAKWDGAQVRRAQVRNGVDFKGLRGSQIAA
jgi:hypothetical protein